MILQYAFYIAKEHVPGKALGVSRGSGMLRENNCKECGACVAVCAKDAISITNAGECGAGPVIDRAKCVSCGLCEKACEKTVDVLNEKKPSAYIGRSRDASVVALSRSGGIFREISEYLVDKKNAVVYGAVLDGVNPKFMRTEKKEELYRFAGSKYAWCDHTAMMDRVLEDLGAGRIVLWSGLPCQVAALKAVLAVKNVDTAGLYTCDIACHGCSPSKLYYDYIKSAEKRLHKKIDTVDFRNKEKFGWTRHIETLYAGGRGIDSNRWTTLFYSHLGFKESCYTCDYRKEQRVGDITLADCWGIGKTDSRFNDDRGCSLVLVSSDKGEELLGAVSDRVDLESTDLAPFMQNAFKKPVETPLKREAFLEAYKARGLDYAMKHVLGYGLKEELIFRLKKMYYLMKR